MRTKGDQVVEIIYLQTEPEELYFHIHEMVRLFFPGVTINRDAAGLPLLSVKRTDKPGAVDFEARFDDGEQCREYRETYLAAGENQFRRLARVFTLDMLSAIRERPIPPYGILTGIRPTKLVHRMIDNGLQRKQIVAELNREYRLDTGKAQLLCDIAERERPFLHDPHTASSLISVYVGIPYCPSRCYYCSFPGTQLNQPEAELNEFLQALTQEVLGVAAGIRQLGLEVENLYIGGGTPSILGAERMKQLLSVMNSYLPLVPDLEFTVEAGRPDTVDEALIEALQQAGVNRVCINPQTMNDDTLMRVGRMHSSEQVRQAVELVRAAAIPTLNMDLIVGLPGESSAEWQHTLGELLELRPENITVHTLAAKKGSRWAEEEGLGLREEATGEGVALFARELTSSGYQPYYLYRQKNMRSDEENIGYTLPGHICRYNIQVIEERQSIIGLGGGAGSKYVRVNDWTLTSSYNPKNPEVYLTSTDRLVTTKVDKLRNLNIELT